MSQFNESPSLEELQRILSHISPNNRETWFKVCAIVGREYNQSSDAFEVVKSWASGYAGRTAKDNKQEEYEYKVSSQRNGPTIGALIKEAKANGYTSPRAQYNPNVSEHTGLFSDIQGGGLDLVLTKEGLLNNSPREALLKSIHNMGVQVLTHWAVFTSSYPDPQQRLIFLSQNERYFKYLTPEVRKYMTALHEYVKTHSNYNLKQWKAWGVQSIKDFDGDEFDALTSDCTDIDNDLCVDFLKICRDKACNLLTIQQAEKLIYACERGDSDKKERVINNISRLSYPDNGLLKTVNEELAGFAFKEINELRNPDLKSALYVPTYSKDLDDRIRGWRRREVSLFAAHSGIGKTWAGLDFAHKAILDNKNVVFVSTEMDTQSISARIFSISADVSLDAYVQDCDVERDLKPAFLRFTNELSQAKNLTLLEGNGHGITIEDIEREINIISMGRPIDLVIVDYIQNVTNDKFGNRNTNNYERVKNTMERLVGLAQKHNCAVLALAQLNNPNRKQGKSNEPNAYDIAECSYIVMDAAAMVALYKQECVSQPTGERYTPVTPVVANTLNLSVTKSRYGILGEKPLTVARSSGSRFTFIN